MRAQPDEVAAGAPALADLLAKRLPAEGSILALGDAALASRLAAYRKRLADEVEDRARRVAAQMKSARTPKSET